MSTSSFDLMSGDEVDEIDEIGLGRLERIDVRTAWKSEALDLTPWLERHLDTLGESLGIEMIPSQREVRVGSYKLDLLAEDGSGRPIIIENQLEPTNHGHLGQVLVYASGLEAAVVVWLTTTFRDEHRRALDWLNERTDEAVDFFGVELDLVRIGQSSPAPVFRLVVKPNDWQKAVKSQTGISETRQARHDFFERALDVLMQLRPTMYRPKVDYDNWIDMSAGPFGRYAIDFCGTGGINLRSEIYIDTGDKQANKNIFDELMADRALIEQDLDETLSWERLEERRASRVCIYRQTPDFDDEDEVAHAAEWAAKKVAKLMSLDAKLRELGQKFRA